MKKIKSKFLVALLLSSSMLLTIPTVSSAAANLVVNSGALTSGVQSTLALTSKVDSNVFQMDTSEDGQIYVTFEDIKGSIIAELFDENGNSKTYSKSYSSSSMTLSTTVKKGKYFLKVSPYDWGDKITSGTYKIKASFASGKSSHDNSFESNDTAENAYSVKSGTSYASDLYSGVDVDWFKFTSDNDGDTYIKMENIKAPILMELYDDKGNSKTYAKSYSSLTASMSAKLKKGTYYVRISPYDWSDKITNGSYTITSTYAVKDSIHDDNYEPNDTFENSQRIKDNTIYSSTLSSNVDVDWYKLSSNQDGRIKISFNNIKGSLIAEIFDENQNSKTYTKSYNQSTSSLEADLKKGNYFVRVAPYDWGDTRTDGSYEINASFSSDNSVHVKLNGSNLDFEQTPIIDNGSTFVPMRAIFEALNASVKWNGDTNTVIAVKSDISISIQIGSNSAIVNGKEIHLENAAQIVNGSTLVPVRFVSESLNAEVKWDDENNTVNISTKK